jgi:hypothetical protein
MMVMVLRITVVMTMTMIRKGTSGNQKWQLKIPD